jgi:hypothetical protein
MQKNPTLLALAVVSLTLAAAVAGAAPADPIEGALGSRCSAASLDVAAEWSADFAAGTVAAREVAPAAPPPCPVERDCTGPAGNGNTCSTNPAHCQVAGPSVLTATHQNACTLPDGSVFHCPLGTSIVIKSAPCTHCRCCSQSPACLCPQDCGQVLRWGCA